MGVQSIQSNPQAKLRLVSFRTLATPELACQRGASQGTSSCATPSTAHVSWPLTSSCTLPLTQKVIGGRLRSLGLVHNGLGRYMLHHIDIMLLRGEAVTRRLPCLMQQNGWPHAWNLPALERHSESLTWHWSSDLMMGCVLNRTHALRDGASPSSCTANLSTTWRHNDAMVLGTPAEERHLVGSPARDSQSRCPKSMQVCGCVPIAKGCWTVAGC